MEKFDLYDDQKMKTGKIIEKGEKVPENYFRLAVHCSVFNKNGEMLIQKRNKNKNKFPGFWDFSVAGGVKAGETSKQAIERELFEELSLKYDFSKEMPFYTIISSNCYDDFYIINLEKKIEDIKLLDGEVEMVKWASEDEILKMIKSKEFIGYFPEFISAIFAMRKVRGIHQKPMV